MSSEDKKRFEASKAELVKVAHFLQEKGLKIKSSQVMQHTIDYFRGKELELTPAADHFHKMVLEHASIV